jgi:hypothetical protein
VYRTDQDYLEQMSDADYAKKSPELNWQLLSRLVLIMLGERNLAAV